MVLMIDNFDSFTYNIVHYLEELGAEVQVFRNNQLTPAKVRELKPSHIVISPGPGRPAQAGCSKALIDEFKSEIPLLGVCLGLQCIGEVFSRRIVRGENILHGKTSDVYHCEAGIFQGIKNPFRATRYHSLIIEREDYELTQDAVEAPVKSGQEERGELEILAWSKEREIMAVGHRKFSTLYGVQFHPESIASEYGHQLLKNFLALSPAFQT